MPQLRTPGGAHAGGLRRRNASKTRRATTEGEVYDSGEGEENQKGEEWQFIKEALISIKEGLEKEVVNQRFTNELSRVIARVSHASRDVPTTDLEGRLERIEALLTSRTQRAEEAQVAGSSWAKIAAKGMRQAGVAAAILPTRHTVRVQMPQAKGLNNEEILKEVKKTISGAAAVRVLHSGDIDITVPDEAAKDRAQGLPSTEELKIFRQDYLVEVPGVPLSVRVACEKGADNSRLATAICEASRTISPGLQITRVRWLHNQRHREQQHQQQADKGPVKTRGTLIIGFQTQAMQRRAISGGLVIDAQLFNARPFEKALLAAQCFKCQRWGHTRFACGKPAKCGQCAGDHSSGDCPGLRVSCVNCGKNHRAWERRICPSFQTYFQGIQSRRIALQAQVSSTGTASNSTLDLGTRPVTQTQPAQTEGWAIISRKRTRVSSPSVEETQRRLGRPTHLEQAARDPSQQRIGFSQGAASASQEQSAETAPLIEVNMSQDES